MEGNYLVRENLKNFFKKPTNMTIVNLVKY